MSKKILVPLFMFSILIGQIYCIAERVSFWPFNAYVMFSNYRRIETAQGFRLYGEKRDGQRQYFDVSEAKPYLNYYGRKSPPDIEALKKTIRVEILKNLKNNPSAADFTFFNLVKVRAEEDSNGQIGLIESDVLKIESGELK